MNSIIHGEDTSVTATSGLFWTLHLFVLSYENYDKNRISIIRVPYKLELNAVPASLYC